MTLPAETTMYDAFATRDASFDGLFIVGVKTTGVFCRPSCPARKPRERNVEYFASAEAAEAAGYRACKRCRPLDDVGASPHWMTHLMERIEAQPERRVTDADLRAMDIDPAAARRLFQSQFGMTFQDYQRALRIGRALAMIREGATATAAATNTGFESGSGFRDAFTRVLGCPPREAEHLVCLFARRISTPLGPMIAGADETRLALLEFVDGRALDQPFAGARRKRSAVIIPGRNAILDRTEQELGDYFGRHAHAHPGVNSEAKIGGTGVPPVKSNGDSHPRRHSSPSRARSARTSFTIPLAIEGTDFQIAVWRELLKIPFGETRSYADIARAVGKPSAVRAVGAANGANRIAIIIPCHRVVRSDGSLCGYAAGAWRKRWLLDHESQ